MKQLLYVYIPGFEYDSKGPLHIDAIRLDVTVDGLDKALPTYIYIYPNAENGYIKGNIVYKTTTILNWDSENYQRFQETPVESPFWTLTKTKYKESHDRVLHGYYYDFVTTDATSENTHHVIGIHTTPEKCLESVTNFNVNEHDGLFAVELENLNTNLILNFTLYSRINVGGNLLIDKEGNPIVGQSESTCYSQVNSQKFKNNEYFFLDLPDDGLDYIEIGKWTQTYNPATSGVKEGTFEHYTDNLPQYFDIANKDTLTEWEIPVNAGILVSDMSKDPIYVDASHILPPIYPLYIYDSKTRKHIKGDNLGYFSKIENNSTLFYSDFYKSFSLDPNLKPPKEEEVERTEGQAWSEYYLGLAYQRCYICFARVQQLQESSVSFDYQISIANTSNVLYLYNNVPYVHISDVSNNTEVNYYIKNSGFLFSLDTLKCDYKRDTYPSDIRKRTHIFNEEHYNNYVLDHSTGIPGTGPCSYHYYTANKKFANSEESYNITSKIYYKSPTSTENVLLEQYNGNLKNSYIDVDYNTVFGQYLNLHSKERNFNDFPNLYTNTYRFTVHKQNTDVLLGNIILNNNPLLFLIVISELQYPLVLWGGNESDGGTAGPDWYYTNLNDSAVPKYPQYTLNVPGQGTTIYNYEKFMLDSGYGKILVGMPSTFQIDLSKSDITYNNKSDHEIVPALVNKDNGYLDKELVSVNVINENLLDHDPDSTSSFELERIVGNIVKTPIELNYNSTFCNDKRFIRCNTSKITINKKVDLESGCLYVFKVLNRYPELTTFYLDGNQLYDNKLLYYAKNSSVRDFNIGALTILSNVQNNNDILSGIGFYKVNLDLPDSVTQVLKSSLNGMSDGFISTENTNIYNYVIFPAIFCAKEDVDFCPLLTGVSGYTYNKDYENTYDDKVIHRHYNFSYLPDKAFYEVIAFYKIPESGQTIEKDNIECNKKDLNLDFLTSEFVRI